MQKENCQMHIMLGNCINQDQCDKNHPIMKIAKKSKLKYSKQIFKKTTAKNNQQSQNCTCCKGNPQNCIKSPICKQIHKCTCIATQKELDNGYNDVCDCCYGNFEDCQTVLCEQLGMCQCQLHKNIENEDQQLKGEYFQQHQNCKCCQGYVFSCNGEKCDSHCFCFN